MATNIRRQAAFLTLANVATRATGFVLHLMLARLMGPEALGVMEMAHSVEMLALTPVVAGVPTAMSRLVAQRDDHGRAEVLRAGITVVKRMAWRIMPAMLLLSPLLAWFLGDSRTLPAILVSVPDVLLLGLCAVYSGYCYGVGDTRMPAISECGEQAIRFLLCGGLLLFFRHMPLGFVSAIPGAAETVAAFSVMGYVRSHLPLRDVTRSSLTLEKELVRLSMPTVTSRFCATGVRAFSAVLLPVCLRRSGLSLTAATAQYGLLTGMALPLMMLPGMVTGAIAMVATPAVSTMEQDPRSLRRLASQLQWSGLGLGVAACAGLWVLAEFIAGTLYHTPALAPLLRLMSPMTVMLAIHQVQYGMIAGLGMQRQALTGTLLAALVQLGLMAYLVPLSRLRLFGAVIAMTCGEAVNLLWSTSLLSRRLKKNMTSTKSACKISSGVV